MERHIRKEATVSASIDEVWDAWTTLAGVKTFFAPKANVELAIGGAYEMLFNPEEPPGSQGGEGLKVLSFLPKSMLSFDWNAPPEFPDIRGQRTWVVVQFEAEQGDVRVVLTHLGWQDGERWDQVYAYFEQAWTVIMTRLEYRFGVGPVDWSDPPRPE
jgi:uncharacterized protein YndB with AHSA1/START domain